MASKPDLNELTRRERQIMDVVYKLDTATAVDIVENLPGKPVNATIRTILNVLESKGFLEHERVKGRFIYKPTLPAKKIRKGMLKHVVKTFFNGAEAQAVVSILKEADASLSDKDREEILNMIDKSLKQGR